MKTLLRRLGTWCFGVLQPYVRLGPVQSVERRLPLLIVVEGPHDVEFLRRISAILHRDDPTLPDLAHAEATGQVSFLPAGGGNLLSWSSALAALGFPELHLYDRELPPVSQQRRQLVQAINARPNCRAVLTRKRTLENYLHPLAILRAGGVAVELSDDDSVALLVAQAVHRNRPADPSWNELSVRARKRRCERVKCWLNTRGAECMTPQLLRERDADGEIAGWLRTASELISRVD